MSPSVEEQMLKQAAQAFGAQAEVGGQDFSQFDVADGQHYGTVMEVGTRITSGGYFQAYIRFVIDSGADKDKSPLLSNDGRQSNMEDQGYLPEPG
jgi:hypothetical protein